VLKGKKWDPRFLKMKVAQKKTWLNKKLTLDETKVRAGKKRNPIPTQMKSLVVKRNWEKWRYIGKRRKVLRKL